MYFSTVDEIKQRQQEKKVKAVNRFARRTEDLLIAVAHGGKGDVWLSEDESMYVGEIVKELEAAGFCASVSFRSEPTREEDSVVICSAFIALSLPSHSIK
jgi:hypothetical protein